MHGQLQATAAWSVSHSRSQEGEVSVFMGVPTMYTQLLSSYEAMPQEQQRSAAAAAAGLRLAISGSAACPVPVMDAWRSISGQTLLERFGMTEVGMALSNPYQGERRPGFVGLPLPGVEARIDTSSVPSAEDAEWRPDGTAADAGEAGELLIRGPNVFKEYWGRPEATAESFTDDGFFRTGDTVTMGGEPPYYKIVGRTSVDIIKSGGYKIGALHIENCVLENAGVAECAAVGVADDTYGQVVGLVLAFKPPAAAGTLADDIEHMLTVRSDDESCESRNLGVEKRVLDYMKKFLRQRLPPYQLPRMVRVVDSIPRNAMGKVNKKQLVKVFDE